MVKQFACVLLALELGSSIFNLCAEEVKLSGVVVQYDVPDVIMIPGSAKGYRLPQPEGLLMGEYHESPNRDDVLNAADTVVIVRISEMIPIGITGLETWYKGELSHSPYLALVWWRIRCEVKDVLKGEFRHEILEFVTAYKPDGLYNPYVRGYVFYFVLKQNMDEWILEDQFRTSSIPPYKLNDHTDYYAMRRAYPGFDWSQPNELIQHMKDKMESRCLDISLEQKKYLIMTFGGDELYDGLILDYDKTVTIVTNIWTWPLPEGL